MSKDCQPITTSLGDQGVERDLNLIIDHFYWLTCRGMSSKLSHVCAIHAYNGTCSEATGSLLTRDYAERWRARMKEAYKMVSKAACIEGKVSMTGASVLQRFVLDSEYWSQKNK